MSDKVKPSFRDSDEWFINNLIGLMKTEILFVKHGKRERVDYASLVEFAIKYRPEFFGRPNESLKLTEVELAAVERLKNANFTVWTPDALMSRLRDTTLLLTALDRAVNRTCVWTAIGNYGSSKTSCGTVMVGQSGSYCQRCGGKVEVKQ